MPSPRRLRIGVGLAALVSLAACRGGSTPAATSPSPAPATSDAPAAETSRDRAGRPAENPVATFDTAWAIIGRTYWDSTFGGRDWKAIGDSLRPKAAAAKTVGELRGVLTQLVTSFGESHFAIIPGELADATSGTRDDGASTDRRTGDIGVTMRWLDGQAVVTHVDAAGPAAAAGVETGWAFDVIDGDTLATVVARLAEHEGPRRAAMTGAGLAEALLQGAPGDSVRISARDRDDRPRRLAIARVPVKGDPVKFGNLPPMPAYLDWERRTVDGRTVGVIAFNVWMIPLKRAFDVAMDSLRDADAIVIDLRGNPGGVGGLSMGVAGHFIDSAVPVGVMQTRGQELKFAINPQRVNTSNQRVAPFAGPVAVLTDGMSASTTEIFAAGMQDLRRARIVGGTTAGMALPAIPERLPNGDILYHAIANFVSPKGRRIEGPGVVPDHVVTVTRADFAAGRDPALEAALTWAAAAVATRTDYRP